MHWYHRNRKILCALLFKINITFSNGYLFASLSCESIIEITTVRRFWLAWLARKRNSTDLITWNFVGGVSWRGEPAEISTGITGLNRVHNYPLNALQEPLTGNIVPSIAPPESATKFLRSPSLVGSSNQVECILATVWGNESDAWWYLLHTVRKKMPSLKTLSTLEVCSSGFQHSSRGHTTQPHDERWPSI